MNTTINVILTSATRFAGISSNTSNFKITPIITGSIISAINIFAKKTDVKYLFAFL